MSKKIFISVLLFSLIIQVIFVEDLKANTAEERVLFRSLATAFIRGRKSIKSCC